MKFSHKALLIAAFAILVPSCLDANSLSVMLSIDGTTIVDETLDIPHKNKFGMSTSDGYVITFELAENNKDHVAIMTTISKGQNGVLIELAKQTFITEWNHPATMTVFKSDSSTEAALSLKLLPQKVDHAHKKSLLRRLLSWKW